MRKSQGGTQMWCPKCKAIKVCAGLNPWVISGEVGQRWQRADHSDVQWFRRGRLCQECGHEFLTAELSEEFVSELVQLRNALRNLKRHAEAYLKESGAAAKSLESLSSSLSVLRALNVYRKT
jgi:hypothetical protein